VLIADDGLQHYALGRDVEICVIDAARGFGNGWLLPAGPLREPPSRLSTVDAIVVNSGGAGRPAILPELAVFTGGRQFRMTLEGREFHNLLDRAQRAGPDRFRGKALHAIAGIGNPQRFFSHLRDLGLSFTAHPFPDHHAYSAADLAFAGADAIVMTEKDAVKCQAFAATTHWVLPVEAGMDSRFGEFVVDRIERRR
jgi:tetraacyldisaccharide 4'-kinase